MRSRKAGTCRFFAIGAKAKFRIGDNTRNSIQILPLAVITWSTAAYAVLSDRPNHHPFRRISRVNAVPHPASRPPNLITSIFRGASQPVQVVMSDEALVLMETMLGHGITLEEYSNQSHRQVPRTTPCRATTKAGYIYGMFWRRAKLSM